jgi:hypothetical protein
MVVRRYLGKQPLDVGADRIARTAVAALDLLDAVRRLSGRGFGVATRGVPPGFPSARGVSEAAGGDAASAAVEVYPAGRLIAKGGSAYARGYRSSDEASRARRGQLLDDLAGELVFHTETGPAIRDVDILDAILCVAAAVDFLSGICTPPEAIGVPHEEADREGWIWLPLQDS